MGLNITSREVSKSVLEEMKNRVTVRKWLRDNESSVSEMMELVSFDNAQASYAQLRYREAELKKQNVSTPIEALVADFELSDLELELVRSIAWSCQVEGDYEPNRRLYKLQRELCAILKDIEDGR